MRGRQPGEALRPVAKAAAAFGVLHLVGVAQHGHAERGRACRGGRCGRGRARSGGCRRASRRRWPPRASSCARPRRTASRRPRPRSGTRCSARAGPAPPTRPRPPARPRPRPDAPVRRVLALNAPIIRCSAVEPCGGIIPIWRAKVIVSVNASLLWISPSRTVSRSKPSSSTGLPVGATPPKRPGPGERAASGATARRSDRPRWSSRRPRMLQVGHRADQLADERAHALRREHVHLAAHVLAAALRPQRHRRVEVARVDRLRSSAGRPPRPCCPRCVCASPPPAACWRPPPAPCVLASLALSRSAMPVLLYAAEEP